MNKLDNSKLTNDAKFLISSMYAEYIKRRREQIRKSQPETSTALIFSKLTSCLNGQKKIY